MNRAEFMRSLGLCAGAALLTQKNANALSPVRCPPNILWLSAEDMGPNLSCYGDSRAHTPTLDRLASEGTRFTNAFTVAPVCAPNRCCIITGVYPTTLGMHHMRSGGEGAQLSRRPSLSAEVRCFSEYLRDAGYYCTNNVKEDYNFVTPATAWDESSNKAHWRNRRESNQPFFAVFNFTGTHESSVRQSQDGFDKATARLTPEQRQDRNAITPPPFHPDTPIVREQWARYHELITALDYWVADYLNQLATDGLADNTIVFFWSDHGAGLPRCKRWLYDSGTHVPLIVRFPKNYKDYEAHRPGDVDDRLVSSIDFAPTVLNLVGAPIPSYMQGQPFLGPSQPTERPYVYGARDRMDERYDAFRMVRDKQYLYIRNYEPFKPYGQYLDYNEQSPVMQELRRLQEESGLTEGTRWVSETSKPFEELFDTQRDPYQMHNLAQESGYADVLRRMREAHEEWMTKTNDLGLIPESEIVELERKCGSRYAIVRSLEEEHPGFMNRLREIAVKAATPSQSDLPLFLSTLQSQHAAIRYWAVIGIRNSPKQTSARRVALEKALSDSSGLVRVAAARALASTDATTSPTFEILEAELKNTSDWIRLQAALALDELGERATSSIPSLKRSLDDRENKYVVRVANHALNALLGTENVVKER